MTAFDPEDHVSHLASVRRGAPLSFGQQRLWLIEQVLGRARPYNARRAFKLVGPLDVEALERSLRAIVGRHEVLRTTFSVRDGEPEQCIATSLHVPLEVIDIGDVPDRDVEVHRQIAAVSAQPFDLAMGPLMRANIFRLSQREHVLLLVLHHAVWDGASTRIFNAELAGGYRAYGAGREYTPPDLLLQYADFTLLQRDSIAAEVAPGLQYWRERLAGAPPLVDLPTDHERPTVMSFRGAVRTRLLSRPLCEGVRTLTRAAGASTFMTLLAAFSALLYRYTGQRDLVIGVPFAGRSRADFEGLIGFFVNTLPLRIFVAGSLRFDALLETIRGDALDAYDRQDVPFERLVAELAPHRSPAVTPLFNVMFFVQGEDELGTDLDLEGLAVRPFPLESTTTKFDLTFRVTERSDGLLCSMQYATDLFDAARIDGMLVHFERLLASIIAKPASPIAELVMLAPEERRRLLAWSDTERPYASDSSVGALVAAQAARTPDAVAVTFGARVLTYRELERRADLLARALLARGVTRRQRIGVLALRDPESVVAMLGILKAGAAYVPLDPEYPKPRLDSMLADASIRLVVIAAGVPARALGEAGQVATISSEPPPDGVTAATAVLPAVMPDDPAYIMYTSGSTGTPKGVIIGHRAIARLVTGTDYVTIGTSDVLGGVSSLSFDAATFEIWGALCNGARLAILPRDATLTPDQFARILTERGVTIMFLTAALFRHVARTMPSAFAGVRYLLVGGEPLDPPSVAAVLGGAPPQYLLNGYGPTECTTFACTYRIENARAAGIPIGRPIANTEAYVLDRDHNLVPPGVTGELYLGGPGLALGYLGDSELTRRKFVPHPFRTGEDRLYATGDLARLLQDGNLEFLGRADRQVKIRGFRVEPGELEAALGRLDDVAAARVDVITEASGEKRLFAYVAVPGAEGRDGKFYRAALAKSLPRHLLPDVVTSVKALPLGTNGKIDLNSLLPGPSDGSRAADGPVVDPTQLVLLDLWKRLLPVQRIGIRDDFFALGGHSLLAARLLADVLANCDVRIPLAMFFENPTVEHLAALVRDSAGPAHPLISLRTTGVRPPFFFLHGDWNGGGYYARRLARRLPDDQPFYALQPHGQDGAPVPESIEAMAHDYAALIRRTCPGPYAVGGFCSGGLVAYEIARLLRLAGETVTQTILIDTPLPRGRLVRPLIVLDAVAATLGVAVAHRQGLRLRIGRGAARLAPFAGKAGLVQKALSLRRARIIFARLLKPVRRRADAAQSPERDLTRAWEALVAGYIPQPGGNVTLLLSADEDARLAPALTRSWNAAAPATRIMMIPGEHLSSITRYVDETAAVLTAVLAETRATRPADPTASP